jgi:hypothetical protein
MRLVAPIYLCMICTSVVSGAELDHPLAKLRAVGPKGAGHKEAMAAWKTVAASPASELPAILAAMDGAGPLAENWIRSAAETVAQREQAKLPVKTLEGYLNDTQRGPRSRRLAYELIAAVDAKAEGRLIPGLIDDPSLELRRDAVALAIAAAEKVPAGDDKTAAVAAWRKAFVSSRDLDQIKLTSDKLKGLGEKVDLPRHFGFLTQWQLIGPFDNKQTKGFDVAYPPEAAGFVADATYDGVSGEVKWIEHTTTDDHGVVDLNKALAKHKGAIAYAYANFDAAEERTVDVRLGSINGNKLWVNGELIFANHVYHANAAIDQYVGQAKLKKGRNSILLKIAQNEQTEPWAQDWQFQLRICDRIGTAVLEAE